MGEQRGGLPESVELAWGLRERPARGPRPGLTLEAIVRAGIEVGAAEGLDAVSMSRVAAEVGVSTMALYRYVSSKQDLLTVMVDAAVGPPPPEMADGDARGWRAALTAWAWAMRRALARHPWVLRIPTSGPPIMPNSVAWMEAALRCMRGSGLDGGSRVQVLLLLSSYVRSGVMLEHDLAAGYAQAGSSEGEVLAAYGAGLATVTDPARFPEVRALVGEGVFDETGGPDDEFVFGLECLLDGVEARGA